MRDEVLASQPQDWRAVARRLRDRRAVRRRPAIVYQKHMTHHMLPAFGLDWMDACANVFLIRAPERVVASYAAQGARRRRSRTSASSSRRSCSTAWRERTRRRRRR